MTRVRHRNPARGLASLFAALVIALAMAACVQREAGSKEQGPAPGSPQPPAGGASHDVEMKNAQFSPQHLNIRAGDTVRWANADSLNHDVTAENEAWQSPGGGGGMSPGDAFERKFDAPGVYRYYCTVHSTGVGAGMSGEVRVE